MSLIEFPCKTLNFLLYKNKTHYFPYRFMNILNQYVPKRSSIKRPKRMRILNLPFFSINFPNLLFRNPVLITNSISFITAPRILSKPLFISNFSHYECKYYSVFSFDIKDTDISIRTEIVSICIVYPMNHLNRSLSNKQNPLI